MANSVTLVEVGPRDGLQSEPKIMPTAEKVEFIRRSVDAGITRIEVVSFVNTKRVPQVEQPKYDVISTDHKIEIRDYAPMIVAEADVSGERDKAIGEGFRIIAEYIFGNNQSSRKVSMTSPVTQQSNEKIAMTAPVTQQGQERSWQVRFTMPASYTLETLPKPNNPAIQLIKIEGKRFAVIRFFRFCGRRPPKAPNRRANRIYQE